jgi:hypothetical protein
VPTACAPTGRQRRAPEPSCQIIPGAGLDEAVSRVVLEAVTPAALEVALEVFDELRRRKAEVDRLRRAQVERAREDAELAQRQFMLVRPEHRLVADTLEQQWNEKLARLAALEDDYARVTPTDGSALSGHDREQIQALGADLPRVWHDPRTPARERKRMLRLLIEDITLLRDRTIQLHIRWKGGPRSSIVRSSPATSARLAIGLPSPRFASSCSIQVARRQSAPPSHGNTRAIADVPKTARQAPEFSMTRGPDERRLLPGPCRCLADSLRFQLRIHAARSRTPRWTPGCLPHRSTYRVLGPSPTLCRYPSRASATSSWRAISPDTPHARARSRRVTAPRARASRRATSRRGSTAARACTGRP